MNLLINEPPLQVLPSLAVKIGLNEALILQQTHYWLNITSHKRDGFKWFYKTYEDWQKEFPFWSIATIRRAISNLEKYGFLVSTSKYNRMGIDKTKWYTINYEKLMNSPSAQNEQSSCSKCTDGQVKMSSPIAQNEHTNNQRLLTENYTENKEDDKKASMTAFKFYEENGFGLLNPYVAEKINAWIDDLNEELVIEAMKIAVVNNVIKWKYVEATLRDWSNKKLQTLADVQADKKRYEAQQKQKQNTSKKPQKKENVPEWFDNRHVQEEQQIDKEKERELAARREALLKQFGED